MPTILFPEFIGIFPRLFGFSHVKNAAKICALAFAGTMHRDGKPAHLHSYRVAQKFVSYPFGTDRTLMTIALLHDVVEDTQWTIEDLRELGFPDVVLNAVDLLTCREGQPYDEYIDQVLMNYNAIRVKIADIEDNLQRLEPWKTRKRKKYENALKRLKAAIAIQERKV